MANIEEIKVPDIGGAEDVEVIEILVNVGDKVNVEDSLITLESDKASMEVPTPKAGVVKELKIKLGDKLSESNVILLLEVDATPKVETKASAPASKAAAKPEPKSVATIKEVTVPDIGTEDAVEIIEINVAVGDSLAVEDTILTLESDKASMELPAPFAGTVKTLKVAVGDKVKQGDLLLMLESVDDLAAQPIKQVTTQSEKSAPEKVSAAVAQTTAVDTTSSTADVFAGPGVRRFARELGVDLKQVNGTGNKGRIIKADVQAFVKGVMTGKTAATAGAGISVASAPKIDFSKFGEIETKPLSKIKRLTGQNVHRSWVTVPHVTQFDQADITELEAFRKENKVIAEKQGFKLTPLVFIMKAVVKALQAFPNFNSSLDATAENLILKKYFHIGVAADTPNGLVVPVIRDVDKKSLFDLAKELGETSARAREKGLALKDMQGGCFTISSLGGISGTAFTPIVNTPDVAILGVSRSKIEPVYTAGEFVPRLMLPLSLSYDHRVIDGAEAARFTKMLAELLGDIRKFLL